MGLSVLAPVPDTPLVETDFSIALRAARACREVGGVMTRALAGGGLQISPPLVIDEAQLLELAAGLRAGLDAVA